MTTQQKIINLKRKIERSYLSGFQSKLNEVLSFAESPIEKLMLIQILNYFQEFREESYPYEPYTKVEFIDDSISALSIDYDDKQTMQKKLKYAKDKGYRFDNDEQAYHKYKAFKVESASTEWTNPSDPKFITHQIEIHSQYELTNYRMDIALILKRWDLEERKVIQEIKLGLECDGRKYHIDRFVEDRIRDRNIKSQGFTDVLRYSGTEIYKIGDNLEQMNLNFKEMMDVVMLHKKE